VTLAAYDDELVRHVRGIGRSVLHHRERVAWRDLECYRSDYTGVHTMNHMPPLLALASAPERPAHASENQKILGRVSCIRLRRLARTAQFCATFMIGEITD